MTKIHRLRFNEQKEGKRDKNGINTSKKLNLHLVHCYLLLHKYQCHTLLMSMY